MMADQPQVEALGDHDYLILVRQGEDIVEVRVHATPAVINRITSVETDETRIIEATAAYLIARQRADDLPAVLDLDDVAAAYEGYIDDISRQLGAR
jgi:Holliday junction resolvase-like predicted endonuclease